MGKNKVFSLSEDWGDIQFNDEIIVYGTGRIGRRILSHFVKEFNVPFLIDNKDAGSSFLGIEIVSIKDGVRRAKENNTKIVVATMYGAYNEISEELEKRGLEKDKDFCIFERFAQEWNLRWQNRCVLAKIDTVITSRCTLKCKKCNIFISHIENARDIDVDLLKENFDTFFDSVDFVYEYTLLGGEPFRHKNIVDIISYLGNDYGDRIGKINLISNGTVIPDEKTLSTLKKYNVSIHISDYTNTLNYKDKLDTLDKILTKEQIEHYIIPNNVWKDIVYPDMSYTAENPREHMRICGHSTHSVGDRKLYWCDPAYAAEKFMGYESKKDDFLDLKRNKANNSKYDASLNIMKYFLGNVNENGYMSLCEKCAGIGDDNDRIVRAGEQ